MIKNRPFVEGLDLGCKKTTKEEVMRQVKKTTGILGVDKEKLRQQELAKKELKRAATRDGSTLSGEVLGTEEGSEGGRRRSKCWA